MVILSACERKQENLYCMQYTGQQSIVEIQRLFPHTYEVRSCLLSGYELAISKELSIVRVKKGDYIVFKNNDLLEVVSEEVFNERYRLYDR